MIIDFGFLMSDFKILTDDYVCDGTPLNAVTFPYELDNFQKHAIRSIEQNHHVIVTAHTGSGKTSVAEYAIARAVAMGKRALYTTPIKALSNQIFKDLRRKYSWDVGIRTGDIEINPDAQVVVMTTEILRNELFRDISYMDRVAVVVFDEVHWIKDRDRGHVWEECIVKMPAHVQMVNLSATIPDADKFGEWVADVKKHPVDLVPTSHRVVPLTHYIMGRDKLYEIMDNKGKFSHDMVRTAADNFDFKPTKLDEYIKRLQSLDALPAFFFCFSRDRCETYANSITVSLIDGKTSTEIGNLFDRNIKKFGTRYDGMRQAEEVKKLLMKGVCYHHSGLMHVLKEIIEIIFSLGLIKILFVTETFAAGVNMPARTVVFTGLQKPDGTCTSDGGPPTLRYLHPEEYSQMAGRAGRRGLDTKGTVIILPFHPKETLDSHVLSAVMTGKMSDIVSRFKIDYNLVLKVLQSNVAAEGAVSLTEFAKGSLLNRQAAGFIKLIESDVSELESKLEAVKYAHAAIVEDPESIVTQYYKVKNATSGKHNKIVRDIKRIETEIAKLPPAEQKKIFDTLRDHTTYSELSNKLKCATDDLDYQQNYIENTVYALLQFLYNEGYINVLHPKSEENFIYLRENLTVKGLIACEISECNSLVLTEMITDGYFNELTTAEIMGVLSMFIDERETERPFTWTPAITDSVKKVRQLVKMLQHKEDKAGLTDVGTDWNIYEECVDLAYVWASGATVGDIYKITDMHEGNFVKAMLKLRKICESVIKSCDLTHNNMLRKKLENYEELLVRSIVTPESLYVKSKY